MTVLIIGKVRSARGEYPCVVNNVSRTGLKARFPLQPVVGERLAFALRGLPALAATVRWTDGQYAGVEFDQALDLAAILKNCQSARLPRAPRFACRRSTSLRLDGHDCHADVLDVSLGGAKLGLSFTTDAVGRPATLMLPVVNQPRAGTVRWDDGERLGFQFAVPLTIDTLSAMLGREPN